MELEHIVVGVDFSDASREAMWAAARLAAVATSRLTLVHVWHASHPYGAFSGNDELEAAAEEDDALLSEWQREAEAIGAPCVSSLFLAGDPADELIELAHADPELGLIVVGTHGRTGIAHVILGSVAEKIVRRAPCPVLAVPSTTPRGWWRSPRNHLAARAATTAGRAIT